jgi:hypothetical protein
MSSTSKKREPISSTAVEMTGEEIELEEMRSPKRRFGDGHGLRPSTFISPPSEAVVAAGETESKDQRATGEKV